MRKWSLLLLAAGLLASQSAGAEDAIRDSVVKILVTQRGPDFARPWAKAGPREVSGSGVIIEGNRILTNAHVVHYASQVYVQANQSAEKVRAKVLAVGPEVDLSLITTEDPSFFEGRPALPLAEGIPRVKDTVNVYGYPIGGEQMSITEGIISRIEFVGLYYGGLGLRVQIDAALNPGNSGGPAIADGRILGLVFSKFSRGESIGYLIAAEEISTFLRDVEDGAYDGKPVIVDRLQTVENAALRASLGLAGDVGGMTVTRPFLDDESYPLKPRDVIIRIGQHDLDRQGKIRIRDDLRVSFQYQVPKLASGGTVPLTVIRDGETIESDVPVRTDFDLAIPYIKREYPRYFILGPLCFVQAYQEWLRSVSPALFAAIAAGDNPLVARLSDRAAFEDEEIVVLGPIVPHEVIRGYRNIALSPVVSRVDETPVKNLAHLVRLLRDASGEYLTLHLAGKYDTLVFRRQELIDSTEQILVDEGIRKQYSDDLRGIWEGEK